MTDRLREEHTLTASDPDALAAALRTSGRAVLFVAASIAAGFGVFAVSRFFWLRLFGTLMPVSMIVSCLASLSIMPVLVQRTRPRLVLGDPSGAAITPL